MLARSCVRNVAVGVASAALVLGCVVQSEPYENGGSGGAGGSGSSSGGSTCSGTRSSQPLLVVVDPNETLKANPGQGVGVFVQYSTGGHWNIWWTCDTDDTNLGCAYDNTVTVSTGTITNVAGQELEASDTVTQANAQTVEAVTTTTTGVDGMTFDTPFSSGQTPVITLVAKLNGCESAYYACSNSTNSSGMCTMMFFVQNGQLDGNYTGMGLTDPLMLEPKSP
jgi:hypothetical protein